MATKEDDYTRYRTVDPQNPPYEIEDIIGRQDPTYTTIIEDWATISGTVSGTKLRTNYR